MNRLWHFDIQLSTNDNKAIYLQITDTIISAIKSKRLKPLDILPSTRKLATIIGVNRNTLLKALDLLMAEGWLVSKDRVGIFVADLVIEHNIPKTTKKEPVLEHKKAIIVLDDGVPNTQIAPMKELASAYRRVFSLKSKRNILGYTNSSGSANFRVIIAQMLNHKRGMHVTPSQIFITRGSQMALYLTAQCLLGPKDIILVESPGYQPAWTTFRHAGAEIMPINVDDEGLIIEEVEAIVQQNSAVKAIYVTPHHQYPTTVTLSLKRRLKLIELAQIYDFIIIEDDYDHEFHFDNRPILPIASYTNVKHCIYIGTFSKVVAPALRIGYLAGNVDLIAKICALREIIDIQNDPIMEQAIVELIKNGDIKRHIKRAAKYYKNKKTYLEELLQTHLKDKVHYQTPTGGLAFWIRPIKKISILELIKNLEKTGVQIMDTSKYNPNHSINGLRLGYGSIDNKDLEEAIIKLSKLLSV
ncbi:MAG: PLP-dependent aminotransferase family protein [Aureispira sp.]|nr:PLP-dependent aminotransferase family protein [Aureispira sp.]